MEALNCIPLLDKRRFSTAFHSQTNCQIKQQNSIIKAYLRAFINFKQNEWAKLLPMMEFTYNNAKSASTGYTYFKLNCG